MVNASQTGVAPLHGGVPPHGVKQLLCGLVGRIAGNKQYIRGRGCIEAVEILPAQIGIPKGAPARYRVRHISQPGIAVMSGSVHLLAGNRTAGNVYQIEGGRQLLGHER